MQPKKLQPLHDYILGLDIGMASVGAALLAEDHILALHVRTFDTAETDKEGESLNKIRRDSRLTRRRIRRRAFRLLRLRRLLKHEGLLLSSAPDALETTVSPWELRAEGLHRKLAPSEWAAVLYHIIKHRGFQSNRKSEAASDEKVGQMLSGVTTNQKRMTEGGWRTVGEMAARDSAFANAKRNKGGEYNHTFARADLEDELAKLFEAQRDHGNPNASSVIQNAIHALLTARRPTLSGENLIKMVGQCTFEPGEFRAPKASHTAERFVWLTRLNNLRISDQGAMRGLNDDERQAILQLPFTQAKVTYKQIRAKADLPDTARFIGVDYWRKRKEGNELAAEDATLFEAKAFHGIRKSYEKTELKTEWARDSVNPDRLDDLAYAQTVFKDDQEARQWMQSQGIEPAIIEAVLNLSFSDFVRLSIKALRKITPFMEAGERYDEAVQSAGYTHHSQPPIAGKKKPRLPAIRKEDFSNPVVYRAINQARKLVNAIIDEYGPPANVHIELARNLSKPFDERKKIERDQKAFAELKDTLVKKFRERFGCDPCKDHLLKMRLYDEQHAQSPYSQSPIDLGRLLEDGYVEIDHALPYSRSFDDSMNNKVLVHTAENRNKGNQIPYEYLDGAQDNERWRNFQAWVESNKSYRQAKRDRLLRKDFSDKAAEGFRERNLTDTRYISKAFKNLVEQHLQLAEGSNSKRCVVASGQLTAFLRTRWGLNKVREDGDLHHALDAAVVAAASHGMVKRLSDYARRKELNTVREGFVDPQTGEVLDVEALRKLEMQFPAPWPHFRRELEAWLSPDPTLHLQDISCYDHVRAQTIQPILVSRAPLRRGLGQAHQETIRSAKLLDHGLSAVKTSLENLKLKDMERILGFDDPRNAKLIDAIRQRLQTHGDDGKKAFKEPLYKPGKPGKAAPIVRTVKLTGTQKSGILVRGGVANNGAMLRVDIFTDGKKFHAVPLYVADAVKTELPNRAVVASKPEDEWTLMDEHYRFLFSLHPNDWVKVTQRGKPTIEGYFSAVSRSTGAMDIWAHDRDRKIGRKGKEGLIEGIGIKTALSVEKFHVDLLGRLFPAKEETRQPLNHKRQS